MRIYGMLLKGCYPLFILLMVNDGFEAFLVPYGAPTGRSFMDVCYLATQIWPLQGRPRNTRQRHSQTSLYPLDGFW